MSEPVRARLAIGVEYDGRRYRGWQSQRNALGVQAVLERALARVADEAVAVQCAGRTDAEVHAVGQVAHFDTAARRPLHGWMLGGNVHLPEDVAIVWAKRVPEGFHARYSATGRRYRYVILNRSARPGLLAGCVSWYPRPLDAGRMAAAAGALLGRHDFSAFRAQDCQARTPVRTLRGLQVQRHGDFVLLDVEADAFLKHMVRNIAGVLIKIGTGERPQAWAAEVLAGGSRAEGGPTAAAAGLYLVGVTYPEGYDIPAPAAGGLPPFMADGGPDTGAASR